MFKGTNKHVWFNLDFQYYYGVKVNYAPELFSKHIQSNQTVRFTPEGTCLRIVERNEKLDEKHFHRIGSIYTRKNIEQLIDFSQQKIPRREKASGKFQSLQCNVMGSSVRPTGWWTFRG